MGIKKRDLGKAHSLIKESDSAMVLSHQNPDGDGIGSALGLSLMLCRAGKKVQVGWPGPSPLPAKYQFLPGTELLTDPGDLAFDGLVIVVDCANVDRLGDLGESAMRAPLLINVDHHPDNTLFGTVNIVDQGSSATAEILYRSAEELGLELNSDAAICFYTGIVTDTGRFQFSNTSAGTLKVASELIGFGVDPNSLYREIFQDDSLSYLRLTGDVLSRVMFEPESGLAYAFMSQAELNRFGVKMVETEDLIDSIRTLKGHRIAALFKELSDGKIRVSLRSRANIDVGAIARRLGGGGHRTASGYTSKKSSFKEALEELKGEAGAG